MMRTCCSMDPLTIDPRKNGDQITSMFHYMLYDGLTHVARDGTIELALADSYRVLDNGLTYEFTLREAYWSNGDPILAKDFELSWKRSLDPSFPAPSPHLFFVFRNSEKARQGLCPFSEVGIETIAPRKLKVTLEKPCSHFLSLLAFCNFYPAHPMLEKNLDWIEPSMVPTSGQFKIASWQKKESICLRKNPLYWNQQNSFLEQLQIYVQPNAEAALRLFEEGRIDFLSTLFSNLDGEIIKQSMKAGLCRFISLGASVFCSFNNDLFPFQNEHIRKAFSFAIDREEIVREIDSPFEIPALEFLPPLFSRSKKKTSTVRFDPIQARANLQAGMRELGLSGEADQAKLHQFFQTLSLQFEYPRIKTAQLLQKHWNKYLGLQVKLDSVDYQTHLQRLYSASYAMAIDHWIPYYVDPVAILERFKSKDILKNYPRFENLNYIDTLKLINETNEPMQRQQLIGEAEKILIEQSPITPLYHHHYAIISYNENNQISYLLNGAFGLLKCPSSNSQVTEVTEQCS